MDSMLRRLGEEAVAQLEVVRELRQAEQFDEIRYKRAKVAIAIISGYVRLRATIANEHSLDLMERRLLGEARAALPAVSEGDAIER